MIDNFSRSIMAIRLKMYWYDPSHWLGRGFTINKVIFLILYQAKI